MVEIKLLFSHKGITVQIPAPEKAASFLIGKSIGDKIKGDFLDMPGYELEITGGSDRCGFPMRGDLAGTGRKKILAVSGVGLKKSAAGVRRRKTVCAGTINNQIVQVNLKVITEGKKKFSDLTKKDQENSPESPQQQKDTKKDAKES
ncbi:MAG: S6e family ribosomal protein [archaeon]